MRSEGEGCRGHGSTPGGVLLLALGLVAVAGPPGERRREGDGDTGSAADADDVAAAVGMVTAPAAVPVRVSATVACVVCFLSGLSPCITASATGYSQPPNSASGVIKA